MKLLSILLRLSLVCMIGYGGFRVFKEQMTARFCRAEAKKLESRFEEFLVMDSDRVHLRRMKSDPSFCSWLYFAPAGEAFELQLQSSEEIATIMRVPRRSSSHYGFIQMQFIDDDNAIPNFMKFEVFGPDFRYYSKTPDADSMYEEIEFLTQSISSKVNPIQMKATIAPLSELVSGFGLSTANQSTHVFCDANQKAVLAYFTEADIPGTAKIKQKDLVVTLVSTKDQ